MKLIAIIGTIILMCGIILVYDARHIAKKMFGYGDQNEATFALKLTGLIMSVVGGFLIML